MTPRPLLLALIALPLLACRPDIGDPGYDAYTSDDDDSGGVDPDFFPGPDPFVSGEERLSIDIFYEGGFSAEVVLDEITSHYYIYDGTYDSYEDFEAREEGYKSDVVVPTGVGWWGGGISWDQPQDLSSWTHMHVSFASEGPDLGGFDVGFGGGAGAEARLTTSAYGFVNDGAWYPLTIPLADFVAGGADLTAVALPFQLIAEGVVAGQELRVDNLYFTKE